MNFISNACWVIIILAVYFIGVTLHQVIASTAAGVIYFAQTVRSIICMVLNCGLIIICYKIMACKFHSLFRYTVILYSGVQNTHTVGCGIALAGLEVSLSAEVIEAVTGFSVYSVLAKLDTVTVFVYNEYVVTIKITAFYLNKVIRGLYTSRIAVTILLSQILLNSMSLGNRVIACIYNSLVGLRLIIFLNAFKAQH